MVKKKSKVKNGSNIGQKKGRLRKQVENTPDG